MMPDWEKLGSKVGNIKISKTEQSEDPGLMKKYKVQGYPTMVLLDADGNLLETYGGDRTYSAFMEYLS
jgi:thioredoxin-related protein